ncbi:MAG: hypothetical protein ACJAZH_001086 [Roseivirga sp.]|jgi:hypothetical protein
MSGYLNIKAKIFSLSIIEALGQVLLLLFGVSANLVAQSPYRAGTAFTTIPMDYGQHSQVDFHNNMFYGDTLVNKLFIVGNNEACVRIKAHYAQWDTLFFIERDSLAVVSLPLKDINHPYYQPITNSITIRSTCPITVIQGVGIGRENTFSKELFRRSSLLNQVEATALLPDEVFAQSSSLHPFISSSSSLLREYPPVQFGTKMPYVLQSLEDSNNLLFKSSISLGVNVPDPPVFLFGPNDSLNISLNRNETYYLGRIQNFFELDNESLAHSLNQKPFKLYTTAINTGFSSGPGGGASNSGFVFEDLKPENTLAQAYHIAPTSGNVGNLYSLIAPFDSTIINYNGQFFLRLDSLQRFDTCLTMPMHFEANKPFFISIVPCLVDTLGKNSRSPYMVAPAGDKDLMQESLFTTLNEAGFDNDYRLSVSLPTAGVGQFSLNGSKVNANLFSPFPNDSGWSWADIPLDSGIYKATCQVGFNAFQYSWFTDSVNGGPRYPSYGYNLSESVVWPEDSFRLSLGPSEGSLDTMGYDRQVYCSNEIFYLSPPKQRFTTWHWTVGDSVFSQVSGSKAAAPFPISISLPGNYTIKVSDSLGCSSDDSIDIEILDLPEANFSFETLRTCNGIGLSLENISRNASEYTWYWLGDSTSEQNPVISLSSFGLDSVLEVQLLAKNASCESRIVRNIPLRETMESFKLPNILTPNGDGINDAFCFENFASYEGCFSISVLNRNGIPVFRSGNPTDCWRPSSLPAGVYFYKLSLADSFYNGFIHLIY